ncbi:MAG: glycosyltransferase family 39 protein [Candidatus Pacebacteria bacterium]|jgi:4-amino-4-deoxy-L-arabinose transferase-like glycosyltransferase|nr:glycosyltransferase family 39 protein [Candidatus Paceibacterota bacterium]
MKKTAANFIAAILILIMAALALASIKDDTLTFDEVAHIGAGYTYWHNRDYRLNPEHPPLVKDLAGLPLQFLGLNFPETRFWTGAAPFPWWTQFDFGDQLLYHAGNDPDRIMFFSRIGPILLMLAFGAFLFFWTRKLLGNGWALFLLVMFVFCPNFMAHGRLVTTDVGASFGAIFATFFWINFLKIPDWKNTLAAGAAFGLAMLIKFSLILLVPFFIVITAAYALLGKDRIKSLLNYCWRAAVAAIFGAVFVIGPVYALHIAQYPADKQLSDTKEVLATTSLPQWMQNINISMAQQPLLRPWAQYLLGLEMATNRTGTGNTTYFDGAVSAKGRLDYFPTLYLVKIPLAFHILTLIALVCLAIRLFKNKFWQNTLPRLRKTLRNNFEFFALAVFVAIYWAASLLGSLNIGLRHILPTFAPTFILVVAGLAACWRAIQNKKLRSGFIGAVAFLMGWFVASSLSIFPHYLTYYNEIADGPDNGYKIAVDSNLDWGQDLKRLADFIETHNGIVSSSLRLELPKTTKEYAALMNDNEAIDRIYLDYFGGGDPEYYLGDKYVKWTSDMNHSQIPGGSYLAISANQMMGQRAKAINGYDQPTDKYDWLVDEQLVAKIGYSIFIYRIE